MFDRAPRCGLGLIRLRALPGHRLAPQITAYLPDMLERMKMGSRECSLRGDFCISADQPSGLIRRHRDDRAPAPRHVPRPDRIAARYEPDMRKSGAGNARAEGWLGREDSNLQPAVPKTVALPIELRPKALATICCHPCRGKRTIPACSTAPLPIYPPLLAGGV